MAKNPTPERLRELFDYDPETGVFVRRTGRRAGKIAGCDQGSGYWHMRVDGVLQKSHRMAWLYVHGSLPAGMIDHINGDRSDNRIVNLRVATHGQNMQNQRRAQAGSASGYLGVAPIGNRWRARIDVRGEAIYLGLFATPDEAHAAYLDAKRRLHEFCTI